MTSAVPCGVVTLTMVMHGTNDHVMMLGKMYNSELKNT